jgi:hypothetical protein
LLRCTWWVCRGIRQTGSGIMNCRRSLCGDMPGGSIPDKNSSGSGWCGCHQPADAGRVRSTSNAFIRHGALALARPGSVEVLAPECQRAAMRLWSLIMARFEPKGRVISHIQATSPMDCTYTCTCATRILLHEAMPFVIGSRFRQVGNANSASPDCSSATAQPWTAPVGLLESVHPSQS